MSEVLDGLIGMDWETEVIPLVDFLNSDLGSVDDEFGLFHRDLDHALTLLSGIYNSDDGFRAAKLLADRLVTTRNEVEVIDLRRRRVRVFLVADGTIDNLWADIICIFLSKRDWMRVLGICPECKTWFARSRSDQIYCRSGCRGKASYNRHREARRADRRKRYRKGRRI